MCAKPFSLTKNEGKLFLVSKSSGPLLERLPLIIPDVDTNQVTMLISANAPEAQVHEECRRGRSGEPYAV